MKNLISKIASVCFLSSLSLLAAGQSVPHTLSLTLEKARAMALERNQQLAAGAIDAKINKEKTREARLSRIPEIYGDLNVQRNLIIPVTPVPSNAFNPNAPEGQLTPLRFTTKWTANTGLNASVDLFNPEKRQAIREALIQEELTRLDNESTRHDLTFEVGKAYAASLIAFEQLRLAVADTLTKAKVLEVSQQQFDQGRLLLASLNQAIADRNASLNKYDEALGIYEENRDQLLYLLGYAPDGTMSIAFEDNLENLFQIFVTKGEQAGGNFSFNKLRQNEALLNTQIKAANAAFLPAITFKAYYGANYFDNNFEIFKSANWNGNSFLNVGVRVPITEGFIRKNRIKQLELEKQGNELRYQYETNKNQADYLAAKREAVAHEKGYRRTQENFQLAATNLRLAEQQFSFGRLGLDELSKVSYNYEKEKNNYLNSAYNYILSRLNMEKLNAYLQN